MMSHFRELEVRLMVCNSCLFCSLLDSSQCALHPCSNMCILLELLLLVACLLYRYVGTH